jgi:hypothetical protein
MKNRKFPYKVLIAWCVVVVEALTIWLLVKESRKYPFIDSLLTSPAKFVWTRLCDSQWFDIKERINYIKYAYGDHVVTITEPDTLRKIEHALTTPPFRFTNLFSAGGEPLTIRYANGKEIVLEAGYGQEDKWVSLPFPYGLVSYELFDILYPYIGEVKMKWVPPPGGFPEVPIPGKLPEVKWPEQ